LADNSNFGGGGGEMGVYDINGDVLTDVVSGTGHKAVAVKSAPLRSLP
jgi:hypothetical protein